MVKDFIKKKMKKILNYFILYKIKPKDKSVINQTTFVNNQTFFGGNNCIEEKVNIQSSKIGFASFVGSNAFLPNTKIGKYTCIAKDVQLILGVHPTHTYVSTHPAFYNPNRAVFSFVKDEPNSFEQFKHEKVEQFDLIIGSDVWIGAGVRIMPGIKIGDGAVIGTGAIITKDIPPYAIAVGIPAKVIKYRFEPEVIEKLLSDRWWEKNPEHLQKASSYFLNVKEYIKSIEVS